MERHWRPKDAYHQSQQKQKQHAQHARAGVVMEAYRDFSDSQGVAGALLAYFDDLFVRMEQRGGKTADDVPGTPKREAIDTFGSRTYEVFDFWKEKLAREV